MSGAIITKKRHNSTGRWWMFLLFVGTSDLEQTGLELSLESVQCHLLSQYYMYVHTYNMCRALRSAMNQKHWIALDCASYGHHILPGTA